MMLRRLGWVILVFAALLITSCGPEPDDPLKPPSVYRNPEVRVTRAPTAIATEPPVAASASATVAPLAMQPLAWPTVDIEQLMNDIESQLSEMENELDRIDTNP